MTVQIIYAGAALLDGLPQADFAVAVEDSRIIAVGSKNDLTAQFPNAKTSGGADFLMMPAFINSHDHGRALGTVAVGVSDSFLELWLLGLGAQPQISPWLAAAYEGIQLAKSGICAVAHSHNPATWEGMFDEIPETLRGYREAGVRVAMHPPLVDQNRLVYADADNFIASLPTDLQPLSLAIHNQWLPSHDSYFDALTQLYNLYHDPQDHKIHIQVSPAGGQWCSDELIMRSVEWAKAHNTRVQMHMLETRFQNIYARKLWGKSFIRHLDDIGALGDWLTLAHMVWVDMDDLALMSERGVGVVHNLSSNLRLRSGIAPIAEMIDAGIQVALGLDGHTLDDDQDFLREMRLAWTIANRPGMDAPDVAPETIIRAGTTSGAAITFGAAAPVGRLAPGYLADLILIDWRTVRGLWAADGYPQFEAAPEFLLRRASRRHIKHVMIHGDWVVRDGKHILLDEALICAAIREQLEAQPHPRLSNDLRRLMPHLRWFYNEWDSEFDDAD
jgi:5-methylthioadenosine/S-adenosylhomocysteine deaminase